jgi:thiopurine S-methyltransferase
MQITQRAVQLLICFEYDQTVMEGPPFSITNTEVQRHYSDRYELRLVASVDVAGGLKGKCEAQEHVWLLR